MTKEEIAKRHKETIFNEMLKTVLSELFRQNQEYNQCLDMLVGKEVLINDNLYMFSQLTDMWTIECKGTFSWMVKFNTRSVQVEDEVHEVIDVFKLAYNEHLTSSPLLADLIAITVEILSSYHPDGRRLKTSQE